MGTEVKPNRLLLAIIVFVLCLHTALADSSGLCKAVNCVMGTCDDNFTGNLLDAVPRCNCNEDWTQPKLPIQLPFPIPFLPCVIPNCTLSTSCSSAAPPLAPPPPLLPPANPTPCTLSLCGEGGVCQNTSQFSYVCNCHEGYENLLNMPAAPCVRDCSMGGDCLKLGINLGGGGTPPAAPAPQASDNNKGSATPPSLSSPGVANVIPSRIVMGIINICFVILLI
ncbi:hypothetical protein SUGI_0895680 [Cryptomeria japonica]|nr:hypothetical protein SUGI_0895680 [Cryptomeria japonica]